MNAAIDFRPTDSPGTALTKIRLARDGLRLSDQHSRNEMLDEFEEDLENAVEYLDEVFIGARYRDPRVSALSLDLRGTRVTLSNPQIALVIALKFFELGQSRWKPD